MVKKYVSIIPSHIFINVYLYSIFSFINGYSDYPLIRTNILIKCTFIKNMSRKDQYTFSYNIYI